MCYSFDILKKAAFEKELEHIELDKNPSITNFPDIVNPVKLYLRTRIREINEKYGETPER